MKLKDIINKSENPNNINYKIRKKRQDFLKSLDLDEETLNLETSGHILHIKVNDKFSLLEAIKRVNKSRKINQDRRLVNPKMQTIENDELMEIYNHLQVFKKSFYEWSSIYGLKYNALTTLIKKYILSMEFNAKKTGSEHNI